MNGDWDITGYMLVVFFACVTVGGARLAIYGRDAVVVIFGSIISGVGAGFVALLLGGLLFERVTQKRARGGR